MAITIQDALNLPIMKETKLIAGHNGLDNQIKWVTIVEVLEDINRLQTGEFLITTGFGLTESLEGMENFINLLSLKKLSAVAIYKDFYLQNIPNQFIDAANKHNLPLIEIPPSINFSMITKAIMEQIVNNQIRLLEYSLNVHREFTKIVLENKDTHAITNTLANLTSSTILLFNEIYTLEISIQKQKNIHLIKPAFIKIAHTEIDIKKDLDACAHDKLPVHLTMSNYRITIYPIIASKIFYGSVVSIKPANEWNEMDDIAIEHAATVYAIQFLKKSAVEDTMLRLQGDFLEEILDGQIPTDAIIKEQGKKLEYNFSLTQVFFYLKFMNVHERHTTQALNHKRYRIINEIFTQNGWSFVARFRQDSLMILTNVSGSSLKEKEDKCLKMTKRLEQQWRYFFPSDPIKIGIGRCCEDIVRLPRGAEEAQLAISLSELLSDKKTIVHYNDLSPYHLLLDMKKAGIDLEQFYKNNIHAILERTRQGVDMINTLETYLKNNQNMQVTAASLFIHRHTLKYRLQQIEKKIGIDLNNPDDRINLHLSVKAYKLMEHLKSQDS